MMHDPIEPSTKNTREPQYQRCVDLQRRGLTPLGLMTNQAWQDDPKHLLFTLSRYKFVAKMFREFENVLEVGCADAFGTRIVVQETHNLTAVDFDPIFVDDVNMRMDSKWPFHCFTHDILSGPVPGCFDGAYALDVLEHIVPNSEDDFIANIAASLSSHGVLILGSPSIESQVYASDASKAGHVNCKDAIGLQRLMKRHFHQAFVFSMNDEVVHTGYHPMAHYLMALCCEKRASPLP